MNTKIVSITGNISTGLSYTLCPNTEFSIGTWQLAISAVCVEALQDTNTFTSITCSASVNQKYVNGNVTIYEQPLNTIHLNLKKNSKSINRFTPIFLDFNRQSEYIEFHFYDCLTQRQLDINANVSINVLFRRTT